MHSEITLFSQRLHFANYEVNMFLIYPEYKAQDPSKNIEAQLADV